MHTFTYRDGVRRTIWKRLADLRTPLAHDWAAWERKNRWLRRAGLDIGAEGFQSEDLVFVSYQNAGVRVYDLSNPFRPDEVAACVPPAPARLADYRPDRPRVVDTTDVYVDRNGLVYTTDMNAGLTIMELEGL